jgi:endonuclease/exonuclease/phosphatase family metal-dependent hydrolase
MVVPRSGGRLSLVVAMVLLPLLSLAAGSCEPIATTWDNERESVPVHRRAKIAEPADPAPTALKVMAWNIKYGAGRIDFWFDMWGDRVQMTAAEVERNLEGIYALINEVKPDVLMTEEIEVNSRRSAYTNMVLGILEHTHLNYAAYMPTWKSRYIPSEGVGRMDLGNAIFSVYPIKSAERIRQVDRTDQDPLTSYFYIHRAVGRAVIAAGPRDVAVMVVHTEAYDTDRTKARQTDQIFQLMVDEPLPFVVGGDFNAIPPGSVKVSSFNDEHPDSIGTDFEQPPYDLGDMVPFYEAFVPHVDLGRYGTTKEEQKRYFTHSVIGRDRIGSQGEPGFWNRQLDYLFVRAADRWVPGTTDVLQQRGDSGISSDPMLLSDHCPVLGTWDLGP